MLARIRRLALARSVVGGPRQAFWLRVGTAAGVAGWVLRKLKKEPQVLTLEQLRPGQSVTITATQRPSRRQRKRARARARRDSSR